MRLRNSSRTLRFWVLFRHNAAIRWKACEWAALFLHLASNSLTIVMPMSLMTLWLLCIFITPRRTPSICYSVCCLWLWRGQKGGEEKSHGTLTKCTQASWAIRNVHRPPLYPLRAPSPPPSFLLASLCLHCFTLLLGLQVIGNGTDPSWSPRLPSWSVNVVWNHTSGGEL